MFIFIFDFSGGQNGRKVFRGKRIDAARHMVTEHNADLGEVWRAISVSDATIRIPGDTIVSIARFDVEAVERGGEASEIRRIRT